MTDTQLLCENRDLKQQLAAAQAEVARLGKELGSWKDAHRNITIEEMGYTMREVEALGIDFQKEIVSDGNALHDVVMKRIAHLRHLESRTARLKEALEKLLTQVLGEGMDMTAAIEQAQQALAEESGKCQ